MRRPVTMHLTDPLPLRAAAEPAVPSGTLPVQVLGGTAQLLPVLGLDARALAQQPAPVAAAVLNTAIAHGIEFLLTGTAASETHIGALEEGALARLFLAGGTAERSCDRALRALDRTLSRLHTDHLALWQVLDLQRADQLETICRPRGALDALVRAREDGRVRFIGLGGDADPAVLLEAMRRFDFDTVTLTLRPGDRRFAAYREQVLPQARRRGMGVIASPGPVGMAAVVCASYALAYLLSLPADLVVLPCSLPSEVDLQVHAARDARRFSRAEMARLDSLMAVE